MDLTKSIAISDLALVLKKENILIIADSHIGYEEALNKQGILIPRLQFKETMKRLENIIGTRTFSKIIINGDIKHEFGVISDQEWRHTLRLLDYLKKHCDEVILIKGNHDNILGPIARKRDVTVKEYESIGKTLIIHGDNLDKNVENILKKSTTIIIGHEHPAVTLYENRRAETFKCFLKGKFKGKTLIVQPSFNLVTEGTDVLKERLLSPFLKGDLSNFEAYIVSDKIYPFGKLKNITHTA